MARIKYMTATLQNDLALNPMFAIMFNSFIATELNKIETKSIDDYAIFIDIIPNEKGCSIKLHDGGATYNPITDDMDYKFYSDVQTDFPIKKEIKLYYSIYEEIICYLSER